MAPLDALIGTPVTRQLIEQIYEAADIMELHELTIEALFSLAEDAIAVIEQHDPAAAARAARTLESDRNAYRARQLKAENPRLSAAAIGLRMARENGRPDDEPYDARQVRRWLARPSET